MSDLRETQQELADDILRRIALRYRNCYVNIYPDFPELTPVEAVLRCAQQEGFHLTNALAEPSSDPKETSVERNLTEHQKQVEEAAGMSLDWPMANAATVATGDLRAKLKALRDELHNGETLTRSESSEDSTPEDAYREGSQAAEKRIRERLTAILDGKG